MWRNDGLLADLADARRFAHERKVVTGPGDRCRLVLLCPSSPLWSHETATPISVRTLPGDLSSCAVVTSGSWTCVDLDLDSDLTWTLTLLTLTFGLDLDLDLTLTTWLKFGRCRPRHNSPRDGCRIPAILTSVAQAHTPALTLVLQWKTEAQRRSHQRDTMMWL